MSHERVTKFEQELARLDALYVDLEKSWGNVPRLFALAGLAPVVWYVESFGWALVELLITAALVSTQAYLIGLRRSENRWNRQQVATDLASEKLDLAVPG